MTQNVHYVRRAVLAAAVLPEILENGTKNDKWDCISYHLTLLSYYYTFCKKFLVAQQQRLFLQKEFQLYFKKAKRKTFNI